MKRNDEIAGRISTYIEDHREEMITCLQKIVQIPSVAVTLGQEDCMTFMDEALRETGAEVDRWVPDWEAVKEMTYPGTGETIYQEVEGRMPEYLDVRDKVSVVSGLFSFGKPGKELMFNGHIDAAGLGNREEWTKDPWGGEIIGDRMYGRATADQKGGVIASLYAVKAVKEVFPDLPGSVRIVVTPEEETGGNGTAASAARGYRPDAAVFTDISNNEIVISNSGMQNFRITISGGADGMWDADYSVSAAELLAVVIQRIHAFARERDAHAREKYGFTESETAACINPGLIECGEWLASVPRKATIKGLMAVLPDDNLLALRKEFADRICDPDGAPFFAEHPPVIEFSSGKEGCETDPGAEIVLSAKAAMEAVRGTEVNPHYGCVCSDMTFYPNLFGTPSILFGPGNVLHCPDEYIELPQFVEIAKAYALMIIGYLSEDGAGNP